MHHGSASLHIIEMAYLIENLGGRIAIELIGKGYTVCQINFNKYSSDLHLSF